MSGHKRRVLLGAVIVLSLLAGFCAPSSISADAVALSTPAPDLVIETITWSPENPLIGNKVIFTATIKNQGSGQANYSHVAYYIDGTRQTSVSVDPLDPGAAVTKTFTWTAQAGSHAITAVADPLSHVNEGDETNNEKTVTYGTATPDLIISTITWSPANPSENATVTLTVTIKNQGSGTADSSWVNYYIDGTCQTSASVNPLGPGAAVTKTFTWTARTSSHTFKAVADSHDRVLESDETNNATTIDLPASAPDLVISAITWSPGNPLVAHRVTFTVLIKNQGTSEASYSRLYFCIDDYYKWQTDVLALDVGATANRTFTWTTREDSHVVKATADAENHANESNETNNEMTRTLTCPSPPTPDLVIQDITWSPENPSIGDTVTFTATIKNQGSGTADRSWVNYYIDGTCQTSASVNPLDPGAAVTKTFTWTAQANSHAITVVADPLSHVTEGDETNNEMTVTYETATPDLVIQDITWSPANPSENATETLTVTIKNQGSGTADRSWVNYYIDGYLKGCENVPEIGAGATATTTFAWESQGGSHTIKAVTDGENNIIESDESNNEKISTFSVLALASVPEPTPIVKINLEHQEAVINPYDDSSDVPPGQDIVSNITEKPSSAPSPGKGIWLNWWFILAALVLVGIVVVVILRSRQRQH
jgi:subtilase family serine protease